MRSHLPDLFRDHAAWLDGRGRSPLYAELMRGAANDSLLPELFEDREQHRSQVPQLRLLAALHELVLAGRAPRLAEFFPDVGGTRASAGAWEATRPLLVEHTGWIRERLGRIVQTNEPGRACALYAGLRHLAERDGRPVRLLELGASSGLNLRFDSFAYRVAATTLGNPGSPLRFDEPWPRAFGAEPDVVGRAGCDLDPLDPADPDDRLRLLSYVWPDEPARIARLRAAFEVAAAHPVEIECASAAEWLHARLTDDADDRLTVVWHSVFWQYLPAAEQRTLEAMAPDSTTPDLAWLSMEPWYDPEREVRLVLRGPGAEPERLLAVCDDHGPPLDLRAL